MVAPNDSRSNFGGIPSSFMPSLSSRGDMPTSPRIIRRMNIILHATVYEANTTVELLSASTLGMSLFIPCSWVVSIAILSLHTKLSISDELHSPRYSHTYLASASSKRALRLHQRSRVRKQAQQYFAIIQIPARCNANTIWSNPIY